MNKIKGLQLQLPYQTHTRYTAQIDLSSHKTRTTQFYRVSFINAKSFR